jgi:hypothetical protein
MDLTRAIFLLLLTSTACLGQATSRIIVTQVVTAAMSPHGTNWNKLPTNIFNLYLQTNDVGNLAFSNSLALENLSDVAVPSPTDGSVLIWSAAMSKWTNSAGPTNGLNGINGTNGVNGTNGLDGVNGTNGLNGANGTNGLNGTSGTNGVDATAPPGGIIMFGRSLTNFDNTGLGIGVLTGWALCNGTNGTPDLQDKFVKGWSTGVNPLGTGGSSSYTPAGSVTAPTFTGQNNQVTSATSGGTPSGSVSAPTFTGQNDQATSATSGGTPAGTVTAPTLVWPTAVPTFTGTPFSSVINHIHAISILDPGHNHTTTTDGGTTVANGAGDALATVSRTGATGTYVVTNNTTGITATNANPSGGVTSITPAGTIAWPATFPTNSVPTFSGSALATHTHTLTSAGTNSAPTFTGDALGTHTHTLTAAGTNSAPSFSGTPATVEPDYVKLCFIMKL